MNTTQSIINYIYAAVFGRRIDAELLQPDDVSFFSTAKKNAVANVVYSGMQRAGTAITPALYRQFQDECDKAVYTYLMQSQQLTELCELFEKAKIPFVLLKGSRMRDFYPSPELRTSSDIDILVRADDDTLCSLMQGAGFSFEKDGGTTLNFRMGVAVEVELHRNLFDDELSFHGYFDSIWDRVHQKTGWNYQYKMTEEDFFVNMIAHFAKHFSRYGCGIRNAVDIAVYLKNAPEGFDLQKAESILKEIDLYRFEQRLLQLISAWDRNEWSEEDERLTDYILGCGIFGSKHSAFTHAAVNSKDKYARQKKLLFHIFPPYRIMSGLYPVLKKWPVLLPFCWIARGFKLLFSDNRRIQSTLKVYSQTGGHSMDDTAEILQLIHLEDVDRRFR